MYMCLDIINNSTVLDVCTTCLQLSRHGINMKNYMIKDFMTHLVRIQVYHTIWMMQRSCLTLYGRQC